MNARNFIETSGWNPGVKDHSNEILANCCAQLEKEP
jgi:hypothetical protein